jgi:hypothetical protein
MDLKDNIHFKNRNIVGRHLASISNKIVSNHIYRYITYSNYYSIFLANLIEYELMNEDHNASSSE